MNVTVENLAPCRRLVRVEVDAQTVDTTFDKITGEFHREARFPGFRPGKAPRDLVTRTYSKQIEDEVKRKLTNENFKKAMEEQKLRVVGRPDIEDIQFGRGQALQFAATVEIVPEFTLPEYKGIPIQRETQSVTDADVEKALAVLREQQATYADVARPIQSGDYVVVNYTGTSEGKPLTEFSSTAKGLTEQKNFWMQIKPEYFIPGFTDQLIGAQAGEHRTVTVDFPVDFVAPQLSGKKGVYEVEIVQVKERTLPEVTDEFAKTYSAENVEKLREGVRRDLQNELEFKQRRSLRNQIIQSLLDRLQIELPESLVLGETRNFVYDIVRQNQERGISKEVIDQQKDEIFNAANSSAKERVKGAFILAEIAEKEQIKVTDEEMTHRILHLAEQHNIKPEKLVKQLRDRNGFGQIHEQILTSKVLDFLLLNAKIEDSAAPTPA